MTRRHSSNKHHHKRPASPGLTATISSLNPGPSVVATMLTKGFQCLYSTVNTNYLAIATVFLMVVLSFVLPDISQKIYKVQELKTVKKVLAEMTKEVTKAEVACLTAAKDVCSLHCSMHDGATETTQVLKDFSVCTSRCLHTTQSAPVQVEKRMGFFRRLFFSHKNSSQKEITLMSYLYTDSFDRKNSVTDIDNSADSA